jgi:hypothetical protein
MKCKLTAANEMQTNNIPCISSKNKVHQILAGLGQEQTHTSDEHFAKNLKHRKKTVESIK